MKILKIIFSIFFLAFSIIWILFAVETFWPENTSGILNNWEWFQINVVAHINNSLINKPESAVNGYQLVLISGAVLLAYTSIIFLVQKIPFIGNFIKTITSFISFVSIILIVIGALLWAGIL